MWGSYVPVAKRRSQAKKKMESLAKKGKKIEPLLIEGRKIAKKFWGEGWCNHLEKFSDFSNRLPRGRTYVRNGSVCHLSINKGKVDAMVMASSLYEVKVEISSLPLPRWERLKELSSGKISSLLELLKGEISDRVMQFVSDSDEGLLPREIANS